MIDRKQLCTHVAAPALLVLLAACGGGTDRPAADQAKAPSPPPAATPAPAPPTDTSRPLDATKAPGTDATVADGRPVYARTCQTCHMANAQGQAPTWPPLAGSEWVNGDKTRMIRIVLHGLQGPITVKGRPYNSVMAPWKSLSDAELAAVITYVRTNFGNTGGPVTVAEVAAQRAATSSRTTMYTVAELNR